MRADQRLNSADRRVGIAHLLDGAFDVAPPRVQFSERLKARWDYRANAVIRYAASQESERALAMFAAALAPTTTQ